MDSCIIRLQYLGYGISAQQDLEMNAYKVVPLISKLMPIAPFHL